MGADRRRRDPRVWILVIALAAVVLLPLLPYLVWSGWAFQDEIGVLVLVVVGALVVFFAVRWLIPWLSARRERLVQEQAQRILREEHGLDGGRGPSTPHPDDHRGPIA